jgi:hypothetical protein
MGQNNKWETAKGLEVGAGVDDLREGVASEDDICMAHQYGNRLSILF